MKILFSLSALFLSLNCFATGQQTFGSTTLRSPFLNMNKCYSAAGSTTINPQGVVNPAGVIIQWGTGTNLITANTLTVTNSTSSSYDTTLYVKVTYNSYVLLDTVKLSFMSSAMAANFVNSGDICVQNPTNTYLDLSCTVTGLGNTSFAPYWGSASNYCQPLNNNGNSNANNVLQKTYWVYTPSGNVATVTLKNTNGCVSSNIDTFTFNLKQGAYQPFSNNDTLIKCGGVPISTFANQVPQTNVSFAWGGIYANNSTTTTGLVNSSIVNGTGYHTGSVTVTNNVNGCVNVYTQVYKVTDLTMSIAGTHSLPCDGSILTLTDTNSASATNVQYLWSLPSSTNYTSFIAGVANNNTVTSNQPLTIYSIHTGTILGEMGTGTQSCQVNDTITFVGGTPPVVTGITATDLSNKTYSFTATGVSNATVYNWDFGDGNASNTLSPTHTYATTGTYTVSLTVSTEEVSCGSANTTKILTVENQNTGIKSIYNNSMCTIYPNPARNEFTIQSPIKIKTLELITPLGNITFMKPTNTVDIHDLSSGIYYFRINGEYISKIVKK